VPVPYFLLFLRFRKVTREIFSELDEMKPEDPIFPRDKTESKEESEGGQGPTTPGGGAGGPLGAPPYGVEPLVHLWHCPSAYKIPPTQKP
jgi:hypothetical protein